MRDNIVVAVVGDSSFARQHELGITSKYLHGGFGELAVVAHTC